MRAVWLVVMLAGCGRVAFDPLGDGGTPGPGDGVAGDGSMGMIDAAVPSGVFAHYPLDDDFALTTTARDISGNNRNMICASTMCPTRGSGRQGGHPFAAVFDGNDDSLRWQPVGGEANLPAFTVTAWIFLTRRPTDFELIVSRPVGATTASSFSLRHAASGRMEYVHGTGNTQFGMSTVPLAGWRHVGISFDGTFKRIYVNGTLEGSGGQGGPTYDNNPLLIGADLNNTVPAHLFAGQISDVVVFSRVLSNGEIAQLAN